MDITEFLALNVLRWELILPCNCSSVLEPIYKKPNNEFIPVGDWNPRLNPLHAQMCLEMFPDWKTTKDRDCGYDTEVWRRRRDTDEDGSKWIHGESGFNESLTDAICLACANAEGWPV